jgi:hypothetical protein
LAGLDPATRELAQARMAAERALYVAQRMPFMLRWQMEVFSSRVVEMPETRQMLTNSAQLTEAAMRLGRTAEELPERFTQERKEILETVFSQQDNLSNLVVEVRDTLDSGSSMASNTTLALASFQSILEQLERGDSSTNAEPFRIRDYQATAEQLDLTAMRLTELLQQLNQTLASTNLQFLADQVAPAVQGAEASGRNLVDHAFKRVLLLVVIGCGLFLVTAVAYRRLVSKAPGC